MLTILGSLLGLVGTLAALFFPNGSRTRRVLFLVGAVLMLVASIDAAQTYFICLEVLIVLGCVLAFVRGVEQSKRVLLAGAGATVLVFALRDLSVIEIIGGIGLTAVALGYATQAPLWYALGSLAVAVRAWVMFATHPDFLSGAFGVLNVVFFVIAIRQKEVSTHADPVR